MDQNNERYIKALPGVSPVLLQDPYADDGVDDDEEFGLSDECFQAHIDSAALQENQRCGDEFGICPECTEHLLALALPPSQLALFWDLS